MGGVDEQLQLIRADCHVELFPPGIVSLPRERNLHAELPPETQQREDAEMKRTPSGGQLLLFNEDRLPFALAESRGLPIAVDSAFDGR